MQLCGGPTPCHVYCISFQNTSFNDVQSLVVKTWLFIVYIYIMCLLFGSNKEHSSSSSNLQTYMMSICIIIAAQAGPFM